MLELKSIRKSYPGLPNVLRGLTLTIGKGVFGLLGPNGAGKSTLIEILAANLVPSAGTATLDGGTDLVRDPAAWRQRLGYLPQGFDFPGQVTGRELLYQVAAFRGYSPDAVRARVGALLERANLVEAADRYAAGYSRGMKQRLGIILALLADPPLLLLDEPTAGLDPVERLFFRELLAEVGSSRVVILSTHIVGDVERCCSRVVVLSGGIAAFDGSPSELAGQARGMTWDVPLSAGEADDAVRSRRVVALMTRGDQPWARIVSPEKPTPDATEVEPGVADGYVSLVEGAAVSQS
jgi:ABC-type multidrug transport system ATPase subunit